MWDRTKSDGSLNGVVLRIVENVNDMERVQGLSKEY